MKIQRKYTYVNVQRSTEYEYDEMILETCYLRFYVVTFLRCFLRIHVTLSCCMLESIFSRVIL